MPKMYEVKVTLLEVEPAVWRTMAIPDDMPLYEVGAAIIGAMGWNGSHMFAFEFDDGRYDIRFDDELDLEDSRDMKGVIARDVFKVGSRFGFQYDFGDDWWHEVEVLDHRVIATGDKPPRCTGGENVCPPDDSGGPYGFVEMRLAASDPKHPDHTDIKDWLGDWDAAAFDPKRADREIRAMIKAFTT